MIKRILTISLLVLSISTVQANFYIPKESLVLTPEAEKKIGIIEKKLNDIKSMQTDFKQITETSNGRRLEQKGVLSLLRQKNKFGLRLQYEPPHAMLVIGMNGSVMYHDYVKDQKGSLNLKSTNAAFLMNEHISFKQDFYLISYIERDQELELRVIQKNNPMGYLDLIFQKPDYHLSKWRVFEPQGTKIFIDLLNPKLGVKFHADHFKFLSPSDSGFNKDK
jgi:outer membrane lipoprotein-sorting protein